VEYKKEISDQLFYMLPELIPFAYCSACLKVVLKHSEEARELYEKVLECYRLPEVKQALTELQNTVPPGKELLNSLIGELQETADREKGGSKDWVPDAAFFARFLSRAKTPGADEKRQAITSEADKSYDLKYFMNTIGELIKVGFNREKDRAAGKGLITPESSPILFLTIQMRSQIESRHGELLERNGKSVLMLDGKGYDLTKLLERKPTTRGYRKKTKAYKEAGYPQLHHDKIEREAERWYMCRVAYSGPREYCDKLLLEQGINLDPSNVGKEIQACDIFLGYPRRT
jgi:hypothetical protein